jgi:DNA-binding transcriptional LysR family regulator
MVQADLADLDAFAAVAGARSFRGAAARRGVSPSSLSEAVRRLEARLGVRLLNRTTRSVTATEAGLGLLTRLRPALDEVSSALDDLNHYRDSPTGTLRLNVPGIVARIVLPAIAARFLAAFPGIRLEVVAEDSFVDVFAAGFDAGVRYDERLEQDMIAIPLGPRRQCYVTAAAPAYLEARGRPGHPRDLLGHAAIRHLFPSGVTSVWEFERDGEEIKIAPPGPLLSTSVDMELAAAVAGLGIVHGFDALVEPLIAQGRLERLLPEWSPSFSGPWLYYPSRRHLTAPMRAFVDFVKGEPG